MDMATKITLQELLDTAGGFVTTQKGAWEHDEWEALLKKLTRAGLELNDETKRNLGNILESAKYFYPIMAAASVAKPAARKKVAAKKPRKKLPS